jgi:uncharacterized protein
MRLDGTYTFDAPRQKVWEVLQDPETLRACMPGVDKFDKVGTDEYEMAMKVGVGAIKGTYAGDSHVRSAGAIALQAWNRRARRNGVRLG